MNSPPRVEKHLSLVTSPRQAGRWGQRHIQARHALGTWFDSVVGSVGLAANFIPPFSSPSWLSPRDLCAYLIFRVLFCSDLRGQSKATNELAVPTDLSSSEVSGPVPRAVSSDYNEAPTAKVNQSVDAKRHATPLHVLLLTPKAPEDLKRPTSASLARVQISRASEVTGQIVWMNDLAPVHRLFSQGDLVWRALYLLAHLPASHVGGIPVLDRDRMRRPLAWESGSPGGPAVEERPLRLC